MDPSFLRWFCHIDSLQYLNEVEFSHTHADTGFAGPSLARALPKAVNKGTTLLRTPGQTNNQNWPKDENGFSQSDRHTQRV
jgi:hypothetical protein